MASLGQGALLLALVLSIGGTVAAFAGARAGRPTWVEGAPFQHSGIRSLEFT